MDTKDRFETGLKFLSTFGSREVFFKSGLTMAAFIQGGKMPVDKDWFTMAVSLLSEYSNSKDTGIRSRTHVLGNICFVNFNTISLVTLKST